MYRTGEIKALFPVKWNTNYTGNKTLTEKVYYRINTGPWVQFDTKTHPYDPLTMEYVDFAQLDVTKLPPGDYKIQVRATASDAPDAIAETVSKTVGGRGKTFIKLEAPLSWMIRSSSIKIRGGLWIAGAFKKTSFL